MRLQATTLLALMLAGCASTATAPGRGLAPDFGGLGPARFGSAEAAVRGAWAGELESDFLPDEPGGCYYLWPPKDDPQHGMAFMFEGGKFVRYDAYGTQWVGPGGVRVGMPATAVEEAFPGRVTRREAVHDPDGVVLVVDPGSGMPTRLVLEVDGTGAVDRWRIGLEPQVHYVEGCL